MMDCNLFIQVGFYLELDSKKKHFEQLCKRYPSLCLLVFMMTNVVYHCHTDIGANSCGLSVSLRYFL